MAFISSCPKCQQQVLVPDGTYPDAVVKCPVCSGEYSMGEILAAAPPALIVVHPGSAPATVTRALTTVESAGTAIATVADSGPLLFDGDRVELGTPDYGHAEPFGSHDAEQEAAAVLFGGEEGGHAAEDLAEPLTEEGHDLAAAAEGDAPWGGAWGGFKDEASPGESGEGEFGEGEADSVALGEPEQEEGLANVDFAAITGKAAPGSALAAGLGAGSVAVEPIKKKKRKREANLVVRFIGIIVSGLLAVVCVLAFAWWRGMPLDFLPAWMQFKFNKTTSTRADVPKPVVPPAAPVTAQTPDANANPASPKGSDAGKQPGDDQGKTEVGASKPEPDKPAAANPDAGNALAMNGTAKEGAAPAGPAAGKTAGPGPFDVEPAKPDSGPPAVPDVPAPSAIGPATKPNADPFGATPDVAPVNGTSKPEVKPETAAPNHETAGHRSKPDADPFGTGPAAPAMIEKSKPDAKTETAAPNHETASAPAPAAPETTPKPEPDPFGTGPAAPAMIEKSNADAKSEVTPANHEAPGAAGPAAPGTTPKPEPDPFGTTPDVATGTPDLKVESPVIGPQPAPAAKPVVTLDVTPAAKPATGIAPLEAPTFTVADLDASLKAVGGEATIDEKSYADWCKLAETVTYAKGGDSQKHALRTLTEKVASNPQAAAAIAAEAKKLFDNNATKGGIVLTGAVTGLGTKNGLSGTAVRVDGMAKPVMVFSSHPLDVKEKQKVIVLGDLLRRPGKESPRLYGHATGGRVGRFRHGRAVVRSVHKQP